MSTAHNPPTSAAWRSQFYPNCPHAQCQGISVRPPYARSRVACDCLAGTLCRGRINESMGTADAGSAPNKRVRIPFTDIWIECTCGARDKDDCPCIKAFAATHQLFAENGHKRQSRAPAWLRRQIQRVRKPKPDQGCR